VLSARVGNAYYRSKAKGAKRERVKRGGEGAGLENVKTGKEEKAQEKGPNILLLVALKRQRRSRKRKAKNEMGKVVPKGETLIKKIVGYTEKTELR